MEPRPERTAVGEVNALLAQLFQAHDVPAAVEGEWVVFPAAGMKIAGAVVRQLPTPQGVMVQLDIELCLDPVRVLLESCAGIGQSFEAALADGVGNFTVNALHVLLAAFFGRVDDQVTREEWTIDGRPRTVTIGPAVTRGRPLEGPASPDWFEQLARELQASRLSDGPHWVRFYHARSQGATQACEVLLDNEEWPEAQAAMAALDWPAVQEFTSVRAFLVIQGGLDLAPAVGTCCRMRSADDGAILRELAAGGMGRRDAGRAVALVPLAFGRVLLGTLGVRSAATAVLRSVRTGEDTPFRLEDDPIYVQARQLAETAYARGAMEREEFAAVALRSAEVDAVNQALQAGSRPEDLQGSPPVLFWSGSSEDASVGRASVDKPRPWWRRWR